MRAVLLTLAGPYTMRMERTRISLRNVLTSILVVVVGLALWLAFGRGPEAADATRTARPRTGDLEITVAGPGRIRARDAVIVEAPSGFGGEVQLLYLAPEGSRVKAGDVLARLDTTEAAADLEEERDRLLEEEATFAELLTTHENAIKNLENQVRSAELAHQQAQLRLSNLEFASELEQQQARLDVEKAQISRDEANRKLEAQRIINEAERVQARIRLDYRRREVTETEEELASLIIRAPMDGIVIHEEQGRGDGRRKIIEGDMVRRRQDLIQLPNLEVLQEIVQLNELDAADVAVGMPAVVSVEAFPDLTFPGRVVEKTLLAMEKDDDSNVRVAPVVVELLEKDDRIRPGMTARAEITVQTLEDATLVPAEAITVLDGVPHILLGGSDEPQAVELGWRDAREVQILEDLPEGARLLLDWGPGTDDVLKRLAGGIEVPDPIAEEMARRPPGIPFP